MKPQSNLTGLALGSTIALGGMSVLAISLWHLLRHGETSFLSQTLVALAVTALGLLLLSQARRRSSRGRSRPQRG